MFEIQHILFKSARWWFSRRDQIDMSPNYQRKGGLWKKEDRQSLIDTIINGYDVPKLYLADFTTVKSSLNEANLRYAVIDGKQRLEAIFSFLANEMPLSDDFVLTESSEFDLSGLYHRDIVEKAFKFAERVDEFPLPIVHVVSDDPTRIKELFLRLNKGLVLTGPEKRSAMIGSVPDAIKELSAHEFFVNATAYASTRGQDLNNAAKILSFELVGEVIDTKKNSLDLIVRDFANEQEKITFAKIEANETLDKMAVVFGLRDKLLKSAGSVPAFYWFIREIGLDQIKLVRAFLENFYKALDDDAFAATAELEWAMAEYKRALRSINDKWSHLLRIELLRLAFQEWNERRERQRHLSRTS